MEVSVFKHANSSLFDESYTHLADANIISEETNRELAEQLNEEFQKAVLPVTVFVGLEVVLGLFGNSLVLYAFAFHYHVCNFRYFVMCLAIIDVTSSLTTIPGEIVTQLYWYVYPQRELCKIKSFFNVFTVSAEAICLLTIAFDRYRKICQPLRWQIKPRTAIYICATIFGISTILAVPVAVLWGTHTHTKVYKGVEINVTVCEKDEQFENTKYPLIYSVSVEVIISTCLVLMLVLYVLVARKLLKEKRSRQKDYSTPPVVVVTPAIASETDFSCNENTVHFPTDFSDTGVSSGLDKNGQCKHDLKDTSFTSDDETDTCNQEFGATLQVPTIGKDKPKLTANKTSGSPRKLRRKMNVSERVRRKTLIMFILTLAFIITTVLYLTLLSFIARSDDILQDMSNGGKAVYFFFFRLYFLNHVINPIIYGLLDPRFKKVMKTMRKSVSIK